MTGFLLDTNVVSELTRPRPDGNVVAFLDREPDLWLCTVVLHELEYGLRLLPAGKRRESLTAALEAMLAGYEDRIIPLGGAEAIAASDLRASAKKDGRIVHLGDALIAGTAATHGLTVATRNISDFEGLGVALIDPWKGLSGAPINP